MVLLLVKDAIGAGGETRRI